MSFLAPSLLLGLLGLLFPLLAHFWHRQKPIVVHFSTLRFFGDREPSFQHRRHFSDIFLLVIRMLLVLAVVAFLAQPVCPGKSDVQVINRQQDSIILLDSSASMQWLSDDQHQSERALHQLEEILDALPAGSQVGLITSSPVGPRLELDQDDSKIRRLIERSQEHPLGRPLFGDHALPMGHRLDDALNMFPPPSSSDESGRTQVIYALGDLSPGGVASLPPTDKPLVIPIPSTDPEAQKDLEPSMNFGLTNVRIEVADDLGNRTIRIRGQIRQTGINTRNPNQHLKQENKEQQTKIGLYIDDAEVARTEARIPSSGVGTFEFVHTVEEDAEAKRSSLRIISPNKDAFLPDNQHFLWLTAPAKLKIVLVNGDPSEHRSHDELFFLATMLQTSALQAQAELRTLAPSQLAETVAEKGPASLDDIDLLVLANVEVPDSTLSATIESRVRDGMGLWITAGDRVSASQYNERFNAVLPLLLREAVFLGTAPGRSTAQNESIAPVDLNHPIFQGTVDDLDLAGTRTRRLFLLEPDPKRDSSIALALGNGAPLLITHSLGEGRVALLTTTIDRDWSDLALRPGFVPMVERTIHWLSRIDTQQHDQQHHVGDPMIIHAASPLTIHQPNGGNHVFDPKQGSTPFADTWQAGWYRADLPTSSDLPSPLSIAWFSMNVDPKESEGESTQTTPQPTAAAAKKPSGARAWMPNWQPLALAALCLMALESFARWRARPHLP